MIQMCSIKSVDRKTIFSIQFTCVDSKIYPMPGIFSQTEPKF